MIAPLQMLAVCSALVVLLYSLGAIASTSRRSWRGHPLRFIAFAAALAGVLAGSAGVVGGVDWAGPVLASGAALYLLANKRRCGSNEWRTW